MECPPEAKAESYRSEARGVGVCTIPKHITQSHRSHLLRPKGKKSKSGREQWNGAPWWFPHLRPLAQFLLVHQQQPSCGEACGNVCGRVGGGAGSRRMEQQTEALQHLGQHTLCRSCQAAPPIQAGQHPFQSTGQVIAQTLPGVPVGEAAEEQCYSRVAPTSQLALSKKVPQHHSQRRKHWVTKVRGREDQQEEAQQQRGAITRPCTCLAALLGLE
eukprot:9494017-Pyramimonas_sp.AAC.1